MTAHHAERRYFRVLPLADFGIAADFEVTRLQLAVGEALGAPPRGPIAVRLHTLAGELLLANLIRLADEVLDVPDPAPAQVEVSFSSAVVPAGYALVIEVCLPGGDTRDHLPGGAAEDRARAGWLAAAGGAEPVLIDTTPDVQLLMTIHGRER